MPDNRPIAVFDSGLGGLTVVRAVRRRLPAESIVYFGDTARVPYGIKSSPTICRFAAEIARFLLRFEPKAMVVACNTASAVALESLREQLDLPIWDVIEPGARLAARFSQNGTVGLLATEATVASDAYGRAIRRHAPSARVVCRAAPLLVPLVEEGRPAGDHIVRLAVEEYVAGLIAQVAAEPHKPCVFERLPAAAAVGLSAVLLGCTHYPLLAETIAAAVGAGVAIIDSAEQTAEMLAEELPSLGLAADQHSLPGTLRCLVSDNPERFCWIGSRFLGESIGQVDYVGPDEFFAGAAGGMSPSDALTWRVQNA